ncbi:MAG: transposase [bacterium]|nr:transposase [bacterium]
MGERSIKFAPGEWYHCYNRGTDKRKIFMGKDDYERMLALLYACNSVTPIHVSNYEQGFRSKKLAEVLHLRKSSWVDVGAYNLMPNHFHLLLREVAPGGITSFMRKFGTAYTMYFNIRYERTGVLFQGTFKAKHVDTDRYYNRVLNYIHANHAELYEPKWKNGIIRNKSLVKKKLVEYRYSSLSDYCGSARPESRIISKDAVLHLLDSPPRLDDLLDDARTFARYEETL